MTVPSALITTGIIIIFMIHSFFQFSIKVQVLTPLFAFFQFYQVVIQNDKVHYSVDYLFFYYYH